MESALLAALGAVLILFAFYVPLLGMIVALVSPLPVAMAVLRHGGRWGLLASIVSTLALFPFVDWITALGLWIVYGWVGLAFGIAVRRRYSAGVVLVVTAFALLLGTISGLVTSYIVTGLTPSDLIEEMIKAFEVALEMNRKVLGPNPQLDQFAEALTQKDVLMKLLPASLVLASLMLAYVNIEVFRRVMPRFGFELEALPPFSRWLFPEIVAWIGLISYLGSPYLKNAAARVAVENIFSVASILGIVEAMSAFTFYLIRANLPRVMVGFALFFSVSVVFTSPGISLLGAFFGMIDMLFDFRHIRSGLLS